MGKRHPGTYRFVCSIAAALIAVFGITSKVSAQDPCKALGDAELVKRGMASATTYEKERAALDDAQTKAGITDEKARQAARDALAREIALRDLARGGSTLRANMAERVAVPGSALVTFEDKRFDPLSNVSTLCVKAFAQRTSSDKWEDVGLRQVFLTDRTNDKPKLLNVIFSVDELSGKGSMATYLFLGALGDGSAISFNHSQRVTMVSKWCALLAALAFVVAFYACLVYVTLDPETKTTAKGLPGLAYVISPVRISAAWFGEASMSQVQLLVFTFIVAGLLFYHWWIAYILSDLSANLLMLIGISAVGTAASKFAQTVKTGLNDQTARYLIGKGWYGWQSIPARTHATASKLLLTDGRLDIYKFQMAIFTVVVACYVISVGQQSLVDVKISETMLYLIGISQGVYVGGKAVTDRTTDLEASVQKMIELEAKIRQTPPPADLSDLKGQYANAARTAAVEFTALQSRFFPTKYDAADQRIRVLNPEIDPIKAKIKRGDALTPKEQEVETEYEKADMTAKELLAYEPPQREAAKQKIENIDPAILTVA